LFLASDGEDTNEANHPGIWRVSMLNGHVLDRVGINREYDPDVVGPFDGWPWNWDFFMQKVEGVCLHSSYQGSTSEANPGQVPQTNKHICTGVWWWELGRSNDKVFFKTMGIP
jgi:hypothetical protein